MFAFQPFYLPEDVGIALGGPAEANVYVLATHYHNEDYIQGKSREHLFTEDELYQQWWCTRYVT